MILYEDDDIIVCHKPAGVPVQSASVRTKDMVSILRTHLRENCGQNDRGQARDNHRSDKFVGKNTGMKNAEIKTAGTKSAREEPRDVYVVHRLDQPVEGVMVFAKTKRAAAELSRQAAGDGMKKRYYAVVELTDAAEFSEGAEKPENTGFSEGVSISDDTTEMRRTAPFGIAEAMGAVCVLHPGTMQDNQWHTLVDYLVKDGRSNRSFVSGAGKKDAKRAELRYRILKMKLRETGQSSQNGRTLAGQSVLMQAAKVLALAEIELKTGRHHQIRVQMAHAGMPLYGDRKYNPGAAGSSGTVEAKNAGGIMDEKSDAQPLALCAVSLTFRHPRTQKEMTFSVEPEAAIFR
ncbi:MAG: pseudouridine synthase [Lachnospiraceae bacterium]|nr:pseudouridine synthase [Lachnospiraceae bacterium]